MPHPSLTFVSKNHVLLFFVFQKNLIIFQKKESFITQKLIIMSVLVKKVIFSLKICVRFIFLQLLKVLLAKRRGFY